MNLYSLKRTIPFHFSTRRRFLKENKSKTVPGNCEKWCSNQLLFRSVFFHIFVPVSTPKVQSEKLFSEDLKVTSVGINWLV